MALEFAHAGASVAITYHTSQDAAQNTVQELRAASPIPQVAHFGAYEADLTQSAQLHALLPSLSAEGGTVTALVNNAAIFRRTPYEALTEADFDDQIAANLKAPYLLCKAFGDYFLAQGGGAILNMADVHGLRPLKNYVPYCVSKAGVVMLTETMALALAPTVRVNCLCPGTMLPTAHTDSPHPPRADSEQGQTHAWKEGTQSNREEGEAAQREAEMMKRLIPLGRIGTAHDVAEAARFLLFGPTYLTGTVLTLDGGRHLR